MYNPQVINSLPASDIGRIDAITIQRLTKHLLFLVAIPSTTNLAPCAPTADEYNQDDHW